MLRGTRCTLHPLARCCLYADCHPGLDPGPTPQRWKALDRRDMSRRAPPVVVEKWIPDRLFAVRDDAIRGTEGICGCWVGAASFRSRKVTQGTRYTLHPLARCCLFADCHPGLDPGPTHQRWKALERRDMPRRAPSVVAEKWIPDRLFAVRDDSGLQERRMDPLTASPPGMTRRRRRRRASNLTPNVSLCAAANSHPWATDQRQSGCFLPSRQYSLAKDCRTLG